jgi:general secretion pathway protein G
MPIPARESRLFFPWEGRRGLKRFFRLGPLRPVLVLGFGLGFVVLLGVRERRAAGVRQTRATMLDVRRSVEGYLADHDGGCPPSLEKLSEISQKEGPPLDAWGRPLRLTCPGRFESAPYELMSDGPDGEPGGVDRIE